jgi:hypothetical protein
MNPKNLYLTTCCTLTAVAGAGLVSLFLARPAMATEQFAKETGKSCAYCHTASAGGGPLTDAGKKFQANGNKLP